MYPRSRSLDRLTSPTNGERQRAGGRRRCSHRFSPCRLLEGSAELNTLGCVIPRPGRRIGPGEFAQPRSHYFAGPFTSQGLFVSLPRAVQLRAQRDESTAGRPPLPSFLVPSFFLVAVAENVGDKFGPLLPISKRSLHWEKISDGGPCSFVF